MYSIANFNDKLKSLRLHRGYKSQSKISRELNIPKQTWSLWEKGERIPTIAHINEISNYLHISPLYFFTTEVDITKFDNTDLLEENYTLPFVSTSISREIHKLLNLASRKPGLYLIEAVSSIGVSRAIFEWQRKYPEAAKQLVIYDHAYNFSGEELSGFLLIEKGLSKVFAGSAETGRQLKDVNFNLILQFQGLEYHDFVEIIRAALPEAPLEIVTLLVTETCFSLTKLAQLVKKLAREKKDSKWEMTFESVLTLCEKIINPK